MFVDPFGRIYEATQLFEPAVRAATVETSDGMTLYARFGDWPGTLCAGLAVLLVAVSWWRRRRRNRKAGALV
jgi:MYXO-CTERM domain-containing protein